MRHPFPLGAASLAVVLLAAGCGSSSTSTTTAASAPASTTASESSTSTSASTTAGTSASASAAGAGDAALITTKHSKLGTVLAAGPKKLTVYLFEADKGASSACSGACAGVWPPVTSTSAAKALGAARAADLGSFTRADGTRQVTYKGHPLYYYVKDKDDGDTYGQGSDSFGAEWYVLSPSGKKIDDDDDKDSDSDKS